QGGNVYYSRQFPFSKLRILTQVTPDLDQPNVGGSKIESYGQLMFWPHVGGQPFRFQCVATDLDGKQIAFDQPMIFMDNTMACPRIQPDPGGKLVADFNA